MEYLNARVIYKKIFLLKDFLIRKFYYTEIIKIISYIYGNSNEFGYQKSSIKKFDRIEEKIDSYQFILNGKYNFNENVNLMSVLTYSANKHKFKNQDRRVFMQDAQ